MSNIETNRKIEELRTSLTEKLGELHRRATSAKETLSPWHHWKNPWVRIGIGAVIGFAVGRRRPAEARTHESLVHSIVRAGLSAAAAVLVTRSLAKPGGDA